MLLASDRLRCVGRAAKPVPTPRILWMGFQDGTAYAHRHPSVMPHIDADRVVDAAQRACERMLEAVEPLDRGDFHPAYTYGWIAGYLAAHHDRDAEYGLPLPFPAVVAGQGTVQETGYDTH